MDPLELARRICLAVHPRFPSLDHGGKPCGDHISDAYTYWILTQPRGAAVLNAIVSAAKDCGWKEAPVAV